jgi:glucose/arabinose dehydrogenase
MFSEIDDRLRDIRTGDDGALYILSEGDNGKLWRVSRR